MRHKNLNKLTEAEIKKEITDASDAIYKAIGAYPTLVRTPYGNANEKVFSVLQSPMIKWNVDTEDWKSRNAQAVKTEIVKNIKDGDIVLMHEIYESTYEGLALALEELSRQGYQFVTVSELMRYRGITPENKIYHSFPPDKTGSIKDRPSRCRAGLLFTASASFSRRESLLIAASRRSASLRLPQGS